MATAAGTPSSVAATVGVCTGDGGSFASALSWISTSSTSSWSSKLHSNAVLEGPPAALGWVQGAAASAALGEQRAVVRVAVGSGMRGTTVAVWCQKGVLLRALGDSGHCDDVMVAALNDATRTGCGRTTVRGMFLSCLFALSQRKELQAALRCGILFLVEKRCFDWRCEPCVAG